MYLINETWWINFMSMWKLIKEEESSKPLFTQKQIRDDAWTENLKWPTGDKSVCDKWGDGICSVQSGRIGADEVIDDADGKGAEELEERLKEKEAKTNAILLEMVRRRTVLSGSTPHVRHMKALYTVLPLLLSGGRPPWRWHETSRERAVCLQTEPSDHGRRPGSHLLPLWGHTKVTQMSAVVVYSYLMWYMLTFAFRSVLCFKPYAYANAFFFHFGAAVRSSETGKPEIPSVTLL